MTAFAERLRKTVEQTLADYSRVLLAFSGGLDSRVLLDLLHQWQAACPGRVVRAVYVHHGLLPQADAWGEFCQRCCEAVQIPYHCLTVQIIRCPRRSIEASAREHRYQALAQLLMPGEAIVTGHHQDDQCETLLLALKRGSGPAGLAAMPLKQPLASGQLCRPLLTISRTCLRAYAQQQQLTWIEDPSNQQIHFDRNFLRQQILPQLTARWPQFAVTSARSARLCGEQEQLLDELLLPLLSSIMGPLGSLAIQPLLGYSVLKRQALLRRWCRQVGAPILSYQQLTHIWSQIVLSRHDANPQFSIKGWQLRRYRQQLYWLLPSTVLPLELIWDSLKETISLPAELGRVWWQSEKLDILEDGSQRMSWLRLPNAEQRVTWRFGVSGTIRLQERGRRSLKKIYQEQGIPPWWRCRLPALYYDDELIAIPGIVVTEAGIAPPEVPAALLVWQVETVQFPRG